jgi:sialic acid synthase
MRKLARDLRHVHQALNHKATDLLPVEQIQRDKLKFKTH